MAAWNLDRSILGEGDQSTIDDLVKSRTLRIFPSIFLRQPEAPMFVKSRQVPMSAAIFLGYRNLGNHCQADRLGSATTALRTSEARSFR